jgi:hypothetical protein
VLGIRDQTVIRGVRRSDDSLGALPGTATKGAAAMAVGDFFQQVRSMRAMPTLPTPLGR